MSAPTMADRNGLGGVPEKDRVLVIDRVPHDTSCP